jgi:catechol 2,3-dioxygenase-like lactoylglutathione lyase family enzyme
MQMVPLFYVDDLAAALDFYTGTLDFTLAWRSEDDRVAGLALGEVDLMLTTLPLDQRAQINAILRVEDVDAIWNRWRGRGLDQSQRVESPVHLAPLDQSWGTREVYVTDPFGNTLRLVQR